MSTSFDTFVNSFSFLGHRKGSEHIDKETVKFDWTFTTDYHGTLCDIPDSHVR